MASAVLPSRNESYWAEREVCMRQFPNNRTNHPHFYPRLNPKPRPNPSRFPNPVFNSNFNVSRQIIDLTAKTGLRQRNEPSPRPPFLPPSASINDPHSFNRSADGPLLSKDPFHREYVTFKASSYSKRELKELKNRLISDLERVRTLLTRIQTRELEFRPGFCRALFRPPAVETNHIPVNLTSDEKQNQKNRASGSVTRKGKGKKNQKLSGQKRALALGDARETKRPFVIPTSSEAEKASEMVMKKCKQILMTLMKQKHSWVFNKPVDVVRLRLHDYFKVIKHPMDLGTIKSNFNKRVYKSPLEFASDVRLTFNNAMRYNPKGQDVHAMAESMLSSFEEMFEPVYQEYETGHRKLVAEKMNEITNWVQLEPVIAMPQPILLSSPSCQNEQILLSPGLQSTSGKLPNPKAKDSNKRQMSNEEKSNLGLNLQHMPQEKMERVVQIVRKRNPHLVPDGDEIELDFEVLDDDTLWDLDRFVSNHKKALSKMKRQELVDGANLIEEEGPKSPVSEPCEVDVEQNNKEDAGEEDVDIGEDIPAFDFPPVVIEKDVEVEKGNAAASVLDVEIEDCAGANGGSRSSSGASSSSDDSSSDDSDSDSGSSSGSDDSDEDSVQSPYVEAKGVPAA
ncbi:transcription factor GTE7-like isoform X1 [Coffea arabica]|uniref:Transcription factor GTE7-like isoform X1 n=1 Tax=Coffea arabica TaxID=13443 RepID=A0A6P6T9F6_COFAR|nr:transcription factor GTE7-like isoform X1 [Coffea arabica]